MPDSYASQDLDLSQGSQTSPVRLSPVQAGDADELFPLIYNSPVTATIAWDGPNDLEEFRANLAEREEQVHRGERHIFTLHSMPGNQAMGSASIRPDAESFRAEMGLWIGEPFHGKGYGTRVVRELVKYGFEVLNLQKIDAFVFTENWASRRIFEKNGFSLEGTIRSAVKKRGRSIDEWLFGLTRQEYELWRTHIVHICRRSDWADALEIGEYRAESLRTEGFIHCSRPEQVLDVANRYYRGSPELVLLSIALEKLTSDVRWEPGDDDDYPHIYGVINCNAVVQNDAFTPDEDGRFRSFPRLI
jgi:uncharacterized protein (DUF952 family)/RimJ/RimL family protein N-acetyltransferase